MSATIGGLREGGGAPGLRPAADPAGRSGGGPGFDLRSRRGHGDLTFIDGGRKSAPAPTELNEGPPCFNFVARRAAVRTLVDPAASRRLDLTAELVSWKISAHSI